MLLPAHAQAVQPHVAAPQATITTPLVTGLDGRVTVAGTYDLDSCVDLSLQVTGSDGTSSSQTLASLYDGSKPSSGNFSTRSTKSFALGATVSAKIVATCDAGAMTTLASAQTRIVARMTSQPATNVYPSGAHGRDLTVNVATLVATPVTIALTRNGKPVTTSTTPGRTHRLAYHLSRTLSPAGEYSINTTIDAYPSLSTTRPLMVDWGWTPAARLDQLGTALAFANTGMPLTYEPCAELTWSVSTTNKPSSVSEPLLEQDLAKAFDVISRATGLEFTQTSATSNASIHVSWRALPKGTSGQGGSSWSTQQGHYIGGVLYLSTTDSWPRHPGFSDANQGRGSLLLHELGHVVGLGHVEEHPYLMSPTHYFGTTAPSFTAEELAGLNQMYEPTKCADFNEAAEPEAANAVRSPGPVRSLRATISASSARLTWTTPIDGPVSGYTVYAQNGNSVTVVSRVNANTHALSVARPARGKPSLKYAVVAYSARPNIESPWPDELPTVPHR